MIPGLSLARYRVTVEAKEDLLLPAYLGSTLHGGPLDVDFRGLIEQAGAVRLVRDETEWTAWSRYSRRQDRRMEWTGVVGAAVYEGDLAPFWPYLVFGQWTHVGSGTTFGLGGYRIEEGSR